MKYPKLLLLMMTAFILQACGSADESSQSRVGIQFPAKLSAKALVEKSSVVFAAPGDNRIEDIWSSDFDPQNQEELNCFGVVIGGPASEKDFSQNTCFENESGSEFNFGPRKMGALAGQTVSLEATSGSQRKIVILAWKAESTDACQTLGSEKEVNVDKLSHPFVIGSVTTDLQPGDNVININASFNASKKLVGCNNFARGERFQRIRQQVVSVVVSGLSSGQSLTVENNKNDTLTVSNNGTFSFAKLVPVGETFSVKVVQQPSNQGCFIEQGSGQIQANVNPQVKINCSSESFQLGGSVSGIEGHLEQDLVLRVNGEIVEETIDEDDKGFIDRKFKIGDEYLLEIAQQPSLHTCSIENASGVFGAANVTNVEITCERTGFFVGGQVSDDIDIREGEPFFEVNAASVPENENSEDEDNEVLIGRVRKNPNAISLAADFNEGEQEQIFNSENLEEVDLCEFVEHFDLPLSRAECLYNKEIDIASAAVGETYTFPGLQADETEYFLVILDNPLGKDCFFSNENSQSTIDGEDITNVDVKCRPKNVDLNVSLTGTSAAAGASVSILLNETVVDTFTFAESYYSAVLEHNHSNSVKFGSIYEVSVRINSGNIICTASTATSGEVNSEGDISIQFNCRENSFSIGGTIEGLKESEVSSEVSEGEVSELEIGLFSPANSEEPVSFFTASENGNFTFESTLSQGDSYRVAILNEPSGQSCSVDAGGAGEVATSDIANIKVVCEDKHSVGGTYSVVDSQAIITITNVSTGESITREPNFTSTPFTFETLQKEGASYNVVAQSNNPHMQCLVENGSGTVGDSDVTNISVFCTFVGNNEE